MEKNQKLVTKSELTSINEANIGRRLLTAIFDAVLFLFLTLILSLWVFTPIADSAFSYSNKMADGQQYQIATRLYVYEEEQENGDYKIIDTDQLTSIKEGANRKTTALQYFSCEDINFYIDRIKYYYLNYKLNENIKLPANTETKSFDAISDKFADPNFENNRAVYNEKVSALEPGKDYFEMEILKNCGDNEYFCKNQDGSYILLDDTKKDSAITHLKDLANSACADFFDQDYIIELNKELSWIQVFIVIPPYVIAFGIFYILIPLLYQNGETLGKKWMKLAIVTKDGYQVKKRQIVFRQLTLFVGITLLAFILGIGLQSLAIVGVGVVVLLIFTLINKRKRSPHDLAAFTVVIDAKTSVWFKDEIEENKKIEELDNKMKQYKNVDILDKKVIQIDDKIINEDVKKELENSKKL